MLQELNVSNNELKNIPNAISYLTKLEVLDCSYNQLKGLPQSFDCLRNLNSLDLRGNTSLPALPSVLTKLPRLENLYVDSRLTEVLPSSLVQQGTSVILQYLSKGKFSFLHYFPMQIVQFKTTTCFTVIGTFKIRITTPWSVLPMYL